MRAGTAAGSGASVDQGPVGREDELARLDDLIRDPTLRLVTVTGPPGVGKTLVARESARRSGRAFIEVDVTPALEDDDLVDVVGHVLAAHGDHRVRVDRHWSAGTAPDLWVLLDGCEDLTGDPHPVGMLLSGLPGLRVLATSLSSLQLPEERVVGLDPLPLPEGGPETLAAEPAVELFLRCAAQVAPAFRPDEADLFTVAELTRRVHGLPLGIELLASRVAGQSLQAILQGLDHGQEVTTRHTRVGPTGDAHRLGLRGALRWSYLHLGPLAQVVLRRMAVFEAPAVLDELVAVVSAVPAPHPLDAADVLDGVHELMDHRLAELHQAPGEPAFALVPLARDLAAELLTEEGELATVVAAHSRAVLEFAMARAAGVEAAADAVAQAEMSRSEPDLRLTLRRLMAEPDVTDGLRLACAVSPFVVRRGHDGWVASALDGMLRRAVDLPVPVRADALLWRARLASTFEGPTAADGVLADLRAGLSLARRLDDADLLLRGLSFVLLSLPATGDVAGASAAVTEGLPLAEARGGPRWHARFAGWSGMVAHLAGDEDRALALAEIGLRRAEESDDVRGMLILALLLAGLPPDRAGRLLARLPDVDELLELAHRLRDPQYEPFLLRMAAMLALEAGDVQRAAQRCAECLRLAARQESWHVMPFTVLLMAYLAAARRDWRATARFHGMLQDRLSEVMASMPPPWVQRHRKVLSRVEEELGPDLTRLLVEDGARAARTTAVTELLEYADAVAAPARAPEPGEERPTPDVGDLTPREREVLAELVTGATNREISGRLGTSPKTVMHHTAAIYRKLGVRSRAEATAWSFRHGLTS